MPHPQRTPRSHKLAEDNQGPESPRKWHLEVTCMWLSLRLRTALCPSARCWTPPPSGRSYRALASNR